MKKLIILTVTLFLLTSSASAVIPASDSAKDNAQAPDHSPVIGEDWSITRVDFVHYAEAKPARNSGTSCYKTFAAWPSTPVSYVFNLTGSGLSQDFVTSTVSASAETWDGATSKELFNNAYSIDPSAAFGVYDHKNTIAFGPYKDGTIAVTSVWYLGKKMYEFDILFNTNYAWGDATLYPGVMDLQNIATHELGHAAGLDDIYNTACSQVTMFGYSDYGDTTRRTLETPDILGLQKLYGP